MGEVQFMDTLQVFIKDQWMKAGFDQPTLVQERTVPAVLEGQDLIVESPTGTGKTLAFVLPLLHRIDPNKKYIQALILAPTRELVMQIHQVIDQFTQDTDIHADACIGGTDIKRQIDKLKKHPQLVVGTPQRILELIRKKKLKMHEIKTIVIDETDQMIANSQERILNDIISTTLKERQLLFFSATISQDVLKFGQTVMKEPQQLLIRPQDMKQDKIEHIYFLCEKRDKADMLRKIIRREQMKALIFVQNNADIDHLAEKMNYLNFTFGVLYGDSHKTERADVMNQFRQNKFDLLLASDIAARGLDFKQITHIIQMDVPRLVDDYVHRSGRTGRMGLSGTVISIVTKSEATELRKLTRKIGINVMEKQLFKGQIVDP